MAFFNEIFNGEITPEYETNNILFFNNDCLKVLETLKDESIDLIASDPPYKISKHGYSKQKEGKKYCGGMLGIYGDNENTEYIRDGKLFKYNDIAFDDWLPILYDKLKVGGHCYLMTNYRNYDTMLQVAKKVGFIHCNTLIWVKRKFNTEQ